MDEIFEREISRYCDSPWTLRDEAIALYLGNYANIESVEEVRERKLSFLRSSCGELTDIELRKVLTLIESQRMRMFMYTSCGWFFNDISGIETRQILAYAIRAIEQVRDVSGVDLEKDFMRDLKNARGNSSELPTGFDVVEKTVTPNKRTIRDIAAAASLLKAEKNYYSYVVKRNIQSYPSANMDMDVSALRVTDARTLEEWKGNSMVITSGGLDDVCRLSEGALPNPADVWKNFYVGDIFSISRFIEREFEFGPWHFADLTTDDKYAVAKERTRNAEKEHMEYAHQLMGENQRLLVQLNLMKVESTSFLASVGEFVYTRLIEELDEKSEHILDLLDHSSQLEKILTEAHNIGISPKVSVLAPRMEKAFYDNLVKADKKNDETAFSKLLTQWRRAVELGVEIDKWELQNVVWSMLEERTSAPPDVLLELAGELHFALPGR
jgi:hypothetical protein